MKKLLLGLGTLAAVAAPVAAVIACGSDSDTTKTLQSTKTEADLKGYETTIPASMNTIDQIQQGFGITIDDITDINTPASDITYKDGKLSFTAGHLDDTTTYTFKITPKAVVKTVTEETVKKAVSFSGVVDAQVAAIDVAKAEGVATIVLAPATGFADASPVVATVTYKDGYTGPKSVNITVPAGTAAPVPGIGAGTGSSDKSVDVSTIAISATKTFTAADAAGTPVAGDFDIPTVEGVTIALKSGQSYAAAGGSSDIEFTLTAKPGYKLTASDNIKVSVDIPVA